MDRLLKKWNLPLATFARHRNKIFIIFLSLGACFAAITVVGPILAEKIYQKMTPDLEENLGLNIFQNYQNKFPKNTNEDLQVSFANLAKYLNPGLPENLKIKQTVVIESPLLISMVLPG